LDFDDDLLREEPSSGALAFFLGFFGVLEFESGLLALSYGAFEACQRGECFYAVNSSLILCSFSYYIFQNTVFLQSNDIGGSTIIRRTVQSLKAAQTMKNERYSTQKVDLVLCGAFFGLARGARGLMTPFSAKACNHWRP
jgi:hypothetical protein